MRISGITRRHALRSSSSRAHDPQVGSRNNRTAARSVTNSANVVVVPSAERNVSAGIGSRPSSSTHSSHSSASSLSALPSNDPPRPAAAAAGPAAAAAGAGAAYPRPISQPTPAVTARIAVHANGSSPLNTRTTGADASRQSTSAARARASRARLRTAVARLTTSLRRPKQLQRTSRARRSAASTNTVYAASNPNAATAATVRHGVGSSTRPNPMTISAIGCARATPSRTSQSGTCSSRSPRTPSLTSPSLATPLTASTPATTSGAASNVSADTRSPYPRPAPATARTRRSGHPHGRTHRRVEVFGRQQRMAEYLDPAIRWPTTPDRATAARASPPARP